MDSEHPFSQVNVDKDPKSILYDTIDIPWGYKQLYLEINKIT